MRAFAFAPCAVALACAALVAPAQAAGPDSAVWAELKKLTQRLEAVEAENRALRQKLAAPATVAAPASSPANAGNIEQRVQALEDAQAQAEKSLSSERISETEPELITRLKAVEFQTLSMQKQARQIEAVEGVSVSASLTTVLQQAQSEALADPATGGSRANYRGDIAVTLPGGSMGDVEGNIFVQARFGQGDGLGLRPTYTGTANSTTFRMGMADHPEDAAAHIAQAWYRLSSPLGDVKRDSRESASLTFGKIDPFVFFDQNAIADDETTRFMNNVFVHNPLLDSGGDAGVDAYGFAPGAIASYSNVRQKGGEWDVSLGAFGSGSGSAFNGPLSKPFMIAQAALHTRFNALPGQWRLYAWHNGRGGNLDGSEARHAGWGLSFDQRATDTLTVFGRFGKQMSGTTRFDRAITLGGEINGDPWGRGADAIGVAAGVLRTSKAFSANGATLDADGDGQPDYGYNPASSERDFELYYRWHVNGNFSLSPDFQLIQRPGANDSAETVRVLGLRARVGF
ncbi:carbohydrate porin [Aquabacterium sp.]|uniref:carbohydrate porin n=1 Tax=Aquabacterium sp. TaxID=1872578 RepID=UPI0035AF1C73